jgi:hypothetical protein
MNLDRKDIPYAIIFKRFKADIPLCDSAHCLRPARL